MHQCCTAEQGVSISEWSKQNTFKSENNKAESHERQFSCHT